MKRIALIGHRGVGKTSLLKRIEAYLENVICIDLDAEIAARTGREIASLFAEGEGVFRRAERETFAAIERGIADETADVYLSVGAGFDSLQIDSRWRVWWIRRSTDANGRIFTNRPRLNAAVSALDEYRERYVIRHPVFAERADETLWLEEGSEEAFDPTERAYIRDEIRGLGGAVTLVNAKSISLDSIARLLKWGVDRFELRDDLLSEDEMTMAARLIPKDKLLVSYRKPDRRANTEELIEQYGCEFDGPLEAGFTQAPILSLHERRPGESITKSLQRFPAKTDGLLKAALPVHNFSDLVEGHRWQQADSRHRSFLPHSPDGRWYWYRLLQAKRQTINFFREGDGSGIDQPTLLEWAGARSSRAFAAVLGDPVRHSRTPMEQRSYFAEHDMPVFAIRVTEAEFSEALKVLAELGLRQAAVTSPLKELAYAAVRVRDEAAEKVRSVNTLDLRGTWSGANTDLAGLRAAVKNELGTFEMQTIFVWGGGGTLGVIREILPAARYYSVRSGVERSGNNGGQPSVVVWAAPRSRSEEPPADWKPSLVFDLNYAEDSAGREYAVKIGAVYISGLGMFRAQAAKQQEFWSKNDERR